MKRAQGAFICFRLLFANMKRAQGVFICFHLRSANMKRAQGCASGWLRLRIIWVARHRILAICSGWLRLRVAREGAEGVEIAGLGGPALQHLGGEPENVAAQLILKALNMGAQGLGAAKLHLCSGGPIRRVLMGMQETLCQACQRADIPLHAAGKRQRGMVRDIGRGF